MQNTNNFLLDTGMNPVLTNNNLKRHSSPNRIAEDFGSPPNKIIGGDMNGPIKRMFKMVPKDLV
jgi:hypothetical protein